MLFAAARMRAVGLLCLPSTLLAFSISATALAQSSPTSRLEEVARAGDAMPRLHSLLVSQHGQLSIERYFNGARPGDLANVKSVSKSVVSALVGIAIEQGYLDGVEVPIGSYFASELSGEGDADKARITVRHLLTMQSGLESTSNGRYAAWTAHEDWIAAALHKPLESLPGRRMQYSTGNTHLLSAMLTRATGMTTLEFGREVLGEPLGFELAEWPRDPSGVYVGGNDMNLTPRQMLAFGELYLNGGARNGRQVVPAAWVDASLQPHAHSPVGEARDYGYGWWICRLAGYRAPHAWGYGGQFIVLVPDLGLVIVTTSSAEPSPTSHEHANDVYQLIQRVISVVGEQRSVLPAHARQAAVMP
jgi:CubicO group peptidase (beta-lactamase class C family)